MKDSRFLKTMVMCTVMFGLAAVLSALLGNMIITDTVYYTVSRDGSAVGLFGIVGLLKDAASWSLFQLLFLFLSGFSAFSLLSAVTVSIIRGVTFGYSAAVFTGGAASGEGVLISGVCFALTSIAVMIFSSLAVCFFAHIREKGTAFASSAKYAATFFVFSGIAVISDGARLIFI
jgi:hypothetical protein